MEVRLHKYLAACGAGSRRQCERWMAEGRVAVDGVPVRTPGATLDPERATVTFDGKPVRPESHVYLALHKPPGYVCTSSDPAGRPRALDLVPPELGRLYTIGRLDANSEGLILLTNDGDFAHQLMHPRHEVIKTYELWLHAPLSGAERNTWIKGMMDAGERLKVLSIRPASPGRAGVGYIVTLGEGKNRHLRRMAARSEKNVLRLKRLAIGSFKLGSLKRGAWRPLTPAEINGLRTRRVEKIRNHGSVPG